MYLDKVRVRCCFLVTELLLLPYYVGGNCTTEHTTSITLLIFCPFKAIETYI